MKPKRWLVFVAIPITGLMLLIVFIVCSHTLVAMATVPSAPLRATPISAVVVVPRSALAAADLYFTVADKPDPVNAGEILHYTIIITNSGNENATSATIVENYDPRVAFVYADPDPDDGSGNCVWTFDQLTTNNPQRIDVVVRVTNTLPVGTILTNRVILDSDQTTPVTVTETTSISSASELTISQVDVPDPVEAGENLLYFISYDNSGTAPVTDVDITGTYGSRVTFVSANPAPRSGTNNVWDIGDLSVDENGYIVVTVRVDTPFTNGTILTNRVTIGSAHTTPRNITETTQASSAPDLTFSVADFPDPVEAGTSLTYTLRYTNTGNADATRYDEMNNVRVVADIYEPDDTCAQASTLAADGTVQEHTFHDYADEDWVKFTVVAGITYVVQAAHTGPDADVELELRDACDQPPLTPDDEDTFGGDARLVFTAPTAGVYYIKALNHDPAVYGEGTGYSLSVRTQSPAPVVAIVAGRNERDGLESNIIFMGD